MNNFKQLITNNIRKFGMIVALVGIVVIFQILTQGILLTPLNITNIIMQNSYVIILAIGMVLVIITGEIDLSVGSVAAFVGAIAGTLMITWELPVIPSIIISLLVGAVIGAWQGFWVAYVKVPAFIVTLAGMLLFRGLTMVVLNGRTLAPFPSNFRIMSSEFMPDLLNGGSYNMMAIIIGIFAIIVYVYSEFRARKIKAAFNQTELSYSLFLTKVILISVLIGLFTERLAVYAGIPYILMILVALIAGYTFFMSKTIPGRHVYAVGGNEKAARLSGVKSQKIKFWIYVNMGVLAALAGLVFSGRLNAATPQAGNLFELDAIAATVIGGASLTGGVGTAIGALIGALIMGVLNNGMSLLGVGIDWQQAIKGLVLLGAVAFDIINKKRNG
ncbi:ABC transporter permease [Halolactibacillus miurensis]|uniref:Xylose transport system permease protein XylH n=1 Tax=Halolactibacillus miurensis TaxID=306541 RepID=A0A1I6SQU6_9BACI|nr:multiple monosaccharide ABC transporter permease [Halolactibacillus miurensis]GEM04167.1 ABC transporter permease [Halolactibacillus miurensis]SFS79158.1 putative multiple sugar transport system permease protein [Halolactibacillus miurensis]